MFFSLLLTFFHILFPPLLDSALFPDLVFLSKSLLCKGAIALRDLWQKPIMLFEIGIWVLLRIDEAVVKLWKVLPYSSLMIDLWPLMDTNNVIVHPDFLLYAMQGCRWTLERWLFLQCYRSHMSLQFFLFIWSFCFLSSSPSPFCSFELQFSLLFSSPKLLVVVFNLSKVILGCLTIFPLTLLQLILQPPFRSTPHVRAETWQNSLPFEI